MFDNRVWTNFDLKNRKRQVIFERNYYGCHHGLTTLVTKKYMYWKKI